MANHRKPVRHAQARARRVQGARGEPPAPRRLPPRPITPPTHVRLIPVARYDFPYQAHLAVALLADAGIPARVTGEALHGMASIFSSEAGGVRVEVPEERAEEARTLLAAADDAPHTESE